MRVFLTGGTGFIGGEIARRLRDRGDEVDALARDPAKADALVALGCRVVAGDLSDRDALVEVMRDADAAIHCAAHYEVGIPAGRRAAMYAANVTGTDNVLCAALDAGVGKVVYVSTVAALGNTRGIVVNETHQHGGRYTSYYEETKHLAHQAALRLIAEGLPCVIVQPGAVYGPGDRSQLGTATRQFARGKLPMVAFPHLGVNMVHRDDVAEGVVLALDKGRIGEQYVLGGELTTMRGIIDTVSRITGRRAPRLVMPTAAIKAVAPLGPVIGPILGYPPNMREMISSADGVTFWARDDKARAELGYSPRGLEEGLRQTLETEGLVRG